MGIRKTKKYLELLKFNVKTNTYIVTIEKIKLDFYGNPRYNVTIFNEFNIFLINFNIQSFNIKNDIEKILEKGSFKKNKICWQLTK